MKHFVSGKKNLKITGLKISPTAPTEDQLKKINQYTRRPFTIDELYIGQMWLANNAIDRDNERYNEEILQHFNRTIIRKTLLLDHDKYNAGQSAIGKFFDSVIETVSLEDAKNITGEDIELPAGVTDVLFLAPWFYVPREGVDPKTLVKIDAGIFDFASIGYRAERLVPITDQKGTILYYEYQGRGEATEGSLVYLGAQHGAGMKDADEKAAVSFSPTIAADVETAWDASAAKGRLAKWASSDGTGDKGTIDWPKYRKGFAWFDSANAESFGSYKLPHHDIIDGKLVVIWKGVSAAMAALMGARGGVDIPEDDWDSVYNHLAKHYKQFDKEVPEKSLHDDTEKSTKGGKEKMKELVKRLMKTFGKAFSEDEEKLHDEIKAFVDEKDAEIERLNTDAAAKATKIEELTPLAADGKAFRNELVTSYVTAKAKLGEVAETPEAQEKVKNVAAFYPIDFLKDEVKALQARVAEKFPDKAQTKGDDIEKGKGGGEEKEGDKWQKAEENPLIPKEEK